MTGVESNLLTSVDLNPICSTTPSTSPDTKITSPTVNLFSINIIMPLIKFLNKSCAPNATATPNNPKPAITGPTLMPHNSRIAANAVVVNDVKENATVIGIPAKEIKIGNKGTFKPYGVDDKVKDEK